MHELSITSQCAPPPFPPPDFTPPTTQTQCHKYLSCFDQTLMVGFWDQQQQHKQQQQQQQQIQKQQKQHFINYWPNFGQTLMEGFGGKTTTKTTISCG